MGDDPDRQDCAKKLAALLGAAAGREDLRTARRLFAQALEAKGGLKIYTIHGFCERLLQRFPLEGAGHAAFLGARRARAGAAARARPSTPRWRAPPTDSDGALGRALAKIIARDRRANISARWSMPCSASAPSSRAWWPITTAPRRLGRRPRRCALKRLFGVAEDTEEEALTEALAGVLTDEEIDAAIAAFAAYGGDHRRSTRRPKRRCARRRASEGDSRAAALRADFPDR